MSKEKKSISESRRAFIATSAMIASELSLKAFAKSKDDDETASSATSPDSQQNMQRRRQRCQNNNPITPPGSQSLQRFKELCTGCQLCVTQCPSHVLRPAGFEFGADYLLKPHVSYYNSYCNHSCKICSEVCPTGAIKPLSVEDKRRTQIGIAEFHIDRCIVNVDENDCGACSEHCPTQAVHMVPYKGSLRIPHVEPELCIGCGGCESICPVRPKRAIVVRANTVHKFAQPPKEEEKKDIEVDDFGF